MYPLKRPPSLLFLLLLPCCAWAHEVRPALLRLQETQPNHFEVLWKVPTVGDQMLRIEPRFPENWRLIGAVDTQREPDALLMRFELKVPNGGLENAQITIDQLPMTLTDVLLLLECADGRTYRQILRPESPSYTIPSRPANAQVIGSYLRLGAVHIFEGLDHLLFLFALLLLVQGMTPLLKAVTAFTLAHSITLTLATLQWVRLSPAAVEATIALSVLFMAVELMRIHEGHQDLIWRRPWLVSFGFGLIHGFGFAGALAELGLPQRQIPQALLSFNFGVELGQVAFLLIMGIAVALAKRLRLPEQLSQTARLIPNYAIGAIAAMFLIQRTAALF